MKLFVSPGTKKKLRNEYNITTEEVKECFLNREKGFLIDINKKYGYPIFRFIAETNRGRRLKVIFILASGIYKLKVVRPVEKREKNTYEFKI